jgi:pimeloyl-ACP methyl ester carboxylesterase
MQLAYAEAGAGPPVCLLHGLFGRRQNLGLLTRRLAASRRVISMDLRNHGASPHAPDMAYRTMAADVLDTLRSAEALPASLLGHSMGGKVAMLTALAYPEQVTRLIVADIAPVAASHGNRQIVAALAALPLSPGLSRRDADALLARHVEDAGTRAFLLQTLEFGPVPAWKIGLAEIAAGMADIEGWPATPPGQQFTGPALFIRGADSDYLPESAMPAIRTLFPAARLETIKRAGHWLHADQPEAFAGLVETFLAEAARPARF